MKIPKRLKTDRACFYELPDGTPDRDCQWYETLFRHQYKGIFKIRQGLTFFFELPDARQRDLFLGTLEHMCTVQQIPVQRTSLPVS